VSAPGQPERHTAGKAAREGRGWESSQGGARLGEQPGIASCV
jgi:hypothetical protein